MTQTILHLYKQNFKFSSAHFLIFDEQRAERLHGHNYQVRVDIAVPQGAIKQGEGYFIDFAQLKTIVKEQLDVWDEHVLLPAHHVDIKTKKQGVGLELHFRERFYVFPVDEVILLPITNTSVEQLSALLADLLGQKMKNLGVKKIRVSVEETRGQSASSVYQVS